MAGLRSGSTRPGDLLLHPVVLVALAVLVINDHLLKVIWPGWLSGKLSDFAGMVLFPCLLLAAYELGGQGLAALAGRRVEFTRRPGLLCACALATGLVFSLVQLWPPAGEAYRLVWGAFGRLLFEGQPLRAHLTADPTDLCALPFAALPCWLENGVRSTRFITVAG